MRIASRTLTLSKGRVKIKLGCPLAETLGCHGTVGIKARRLSLGSAKFRIRGGHTRTVTVRVSKRARALVGHRVRLVVTGIDAAGNKKTTTKRMALRTP
jgi:hypothetical protein